MSPAGWRGKNLVLPRSRSLGGCRSKLFLNRLTSSNLTLCSINNISTMNTAMKIIFAIATMLAHVTAPAESYRLLTASAANSSCVGFELGLVLVLEQETRNRCVDSDRDIPAVPNPEIASTAAVISDEILPMDFNDTAGKSIKKNKVRVRDQMFRRISFCFGPTILNTAFSYPKEFFHPNEGSLSTASKQSVRLLTTSAAKDGGSWVWLFAGFLKQKINITTASKAGAWSVGSVPNPKNASFAAIVSTEILPMILNDTAGKINKNDVHVRDMFCPNSFFYTTHDVRRVLLILPC
jgi:hypothetical protein